MFNRHLKTEQLVSHKGNRIPDSRGTSNSEMTPIDYGIAAEPPLLRLIIGLSGILISVFIKQPVVLVQHRYNNGGSLVLSDLVILQMFHYPN